jgi:hypothetical protein
MVLAGQQITLRQTGLKTPLHTTQKSRPLYNKVVRRGNVGCLALMLQFEQPLTANR